APPAWSFTRRRDRIKNHGDHKTAALATLRHVLYTLSLGIAPAMPFLAEDVYAKVREDHDPESVHLCAWPAKEKGILPFLPFFADKKTDGADVLNMSEVRRAVSLGLEKRAAANIKVRQPLLEVRIKSVLLKDKHEFIDLIRDELNVKRVAVDPTMEGDIELNTEITPELKEEGMVREVLRFVQDLRKQAGFSPRDVGVLRIAPENRVFVETHWTVLAKTANLVKFEEGAAENELSVEGVTFRFNVERA
ncbi:class I tRNA ligase family protein, partial [Patescibacteria group bacterium]|nr:class I tRNA ligase family protein [Patescibacteria group bacterium]